MLLLFFPPVYCESKKVPYRFAKDLKLKQSDGPFVLIFFVWVCTRQYSCTAVDICCTDILCFLSLCEPNLLITFTQCLFMPIKYLPGLFVHKSLFRYAFFICALFLFNPFSPAVRNERCLLCLTRGSELCPGPQMHQHQYLCVRKAQLQLFHSASRACVTYWAVLFATLRASDWFVWSALIWRYKLDYPRAFEQCHGYIHSLNLVCGQNQFSWVDRKYRILKCAVATRLDGGRLPLVKCLWGHLVFLTNWARRFLWTSTQCKFEMRMSGRNPRATSIIKHLLSFSFQLMFWED